MARFFDVHPVNPQQRLINQVVQMIQQDALIAYPTDSGYALGCQLGSTAGVDRIRRIRHLDERHHFALVCADMAQVGQYVQLDTSAFRAIKSATPGPYTFILKATRDVPRRMAHPKKRTVGIRIPRHTVVAALLRELGEPLASSTLLLPGQHDVWTEGWFVKEELDSVIDAVVDCGVCGDRPTTVIDYSQGYPELTRLGAGDPARFGG